MDKIKICELFEINNNLIAPIFKDSTYPWEILPHIKSYIECLIASKPSGFYEYAPNVLIGKNVKIASNVTITAPAIICDNTEIRTGAFIRGSVFIGEGAVIGNSTELKNCIILNGAQVPHYNYVGDSVLGNKSHLGAGAICSNLKADKKNVVIKGEKEYQTGIKKIGAILGDGTDIGCGCVLNPGTVIGKNTNVYPLTSVRGVIPENRIVKSMQNIVVKEA